MSGRNVVPWLQKSLSGLGQEIPSLQAGEDVKS